jgi:hypothetical protein
VSFPFWRLNLDELDVDSAYASAFLILKSFKIIPLQLSCMALACVLTGLLSDGLSVIPRDRSRHTNCVTPARCSRQEYVPNRNPRSRTL